MNVFKKTLVLFLLCIVCDIIVMFLPFPFPGSVLAMIILFLLLLLGYVKIRHTEPVGDFLLKNMTLVFVPATVSIMSYVDILKDILWQFVFICVATTVFTFACTAYSVKLTLYLMKKFKKEED